MSTSTNKEQELRQRNTADIADKKDEEEVIKIPSSSNEKGNVEPGPVTKQTMISLMIVLFSVFLDYMGVSIVAPILPFYAEMFNASSTELGALYSSYSGMSLLAALFMGKFSDIFGRKPMILFSLFGTCVGFLACGLAQNYGQLLGFRFLTGIFGATAPVAMAIITDVVPSISRSKYLAANGVVMTVSFIVGPGLGAGLSEFGIRVPFFVSSGLGAFGFIFALILLRESHPAIIQKRMLKNRKKFDKQLNNSSPEEEEMKVKEAIENIIDPEDDGYDELDKIKIVQEKDEDINRNDVGVEIQNEESSKVPIQVWLIYLVTILTTLGFTVYSSMFALYVIDLYDLSTLAVGYITLVLAIVVTFGNVIFVKGSKLFGMYIEIIIACCWCGIGLLFPPFIDNLWGLLAMVVFGFGIGYGQIFPAMPATAASWTNEKNRGLILGLSNSASNVAFIIGPLLHGVLYGIDKRYPWFVGGAAVLLGGFVVIIMICKWPELKYPVKKDENEVDVLTAEDIENWKYIPDKVRRKDYVRLGKALGVMLSNKRYNWVGHVDKVIEFLDTVFPPMHPDNLKARRDATDFFMNSAKEIRAQFDSLGYAAEAAAHF